ncbi:hypothetical protein [Serratia fonticola]|uniref:hypothetical protein n=1 Tax=Serratia fonticola TaxID=47917 RepID=UPI0004285A2F|nr:hypothetical protein [Serratia fonticola]
MKQRLIKTASCGIASMVLMMPLAAPVLAETITIGKGTGILWEGMPFDVTLSGPLMDPRLNPTYALLSVSTSTRECMSSTALKNIGGYLAFPLDGVPGVGLIPQAMGSANYTQYNNLPGSLNGTIGLPETRGSSTAQENITPPSGKAWCLPPAMSTRNEFYSDSGPRTATLRGNWALVADGTQQAGEGSVPPMYFGSFAHNTAGDKFASILPSNISLRISTLECSVNTPTTINFGSVIRNTQANAELAVKSVPLVTTCGQTNNHINANINLQFRATSGQYDSTASRLALNQGGGYITGEIDNGVTGSGDCKATTGLPFDGTRIKLGSITSAESNKTLTNQLTWRLCSGGSSVPIGAVTASTEMLVTFN